MGMGDRILNQVLYQAGAGVAPPPRPAPRTLPKRAAVYPLLEWFDDQGPLDAPELNPGETYTARLCLSPQPHGADAHALTCYGDTIAFMLACPEFPDVQVVADEAVTTLHHALLKEDQEILFEVVVPPGCPRLTTPLILSAGPPAGRGQHLALTPITILGDYDLPDTDLLDKCAVALDAALPQDMAFLYVTESDTGLSYTGWFRGGRVSDQAFKPDLSLGRLVGERRVPRDMYTQIVAFSRNQIGPLQAWFNQLLALAQPTLLVADHTDAEIPWELVKLANHTHLGEAVAVVRWTDIHCFDTRLRLTPAVEAVRGGVVAYMRAADKPAMRAENAALTELRAQREQGLDLLTQKLMAGLRDTCLLYLGCHGEFVYEKRRVDRFQELLAHDGDDRMLGFDLELVDTPPRPRPLVVVNACHSARLMREGGVLYGLPEHFLARVAHGYIGTLGEVGQDQASRIGTRLLQALKNGTDGGRPAVLLRKIRQEAAARLDPVAADDKAWLDFLYPFMYVYYGNPFTALLPDGEAPP